MLPSSQSSDDISKDEKTKALAQKYFSTPKTIGKFKIDGFYAQGGMSMLYLATDPIRQEQIIIKVLQPKLLADKQSVEEFMNEATIISSTNHPNIVKLYEYGEWEGGLYIAMEFIKGQSLRKLLQHNPLPLKRAIDVLIQISYALWHLHNLGIIHGDLKPENILITDQGQVKLIDFGISKVLSTAPHLEESVPRTFKGTPIYMSPELHTNPKGYSFQSDIYALGILAYELVLGKITHGKVILSLAPRGMQKILNKALKPNPLERYSSILDIIQDLSDYTHSGEISKDRQGADYFFELFEQLEEQQKSLMRSLQPLEQKAWKIGIAPSFGIGVKGLYYSCIEHNSGLLLFACATNSHGVQGVLTVFQIDAIWKTLLNKNYDQSICIPPNALELFQELERQSIHISEASIMWVDFSSFTYKWITSKWATLFLLKTEREKDIAHSVSSPIKIISPFQSEPLEGLEKPFSRIYEGSFSQDDELFISCCITPKLLEFPSAPNAPFDMMLTKILQDALSLPPQKKAESILQTLRLQGDCMIEDHPALFASLKLQDVSNSGIKRDDCRNKSIISEI